MRRHECLHWHADIPCVVQLCYRGQRQLLGILLTGIHGVRWAGGEEKGMQAASSRSRDSGHSPSIEDRREDTGK